MSNNSSWFIIVGILIAIAMVVFIMKMGTLGREYLKNNCSFPYLWIIRITFIFYALFLFLPEQLYGRARRIGAEETLFYGLRVFFEKYDIQIIVGIFFVLLVSVIIVTLINKLTFKDGLKIFFSATIYTTKLIVTLYLIVLLIVSLFILLVMKIGKSTIPSKVVYYYY